MILRYIFLVMLLTSIFSCEKSDDETNIIPSESMYFPPNNSNNWETSSPSSLNWNQNNLQELKDFLIEENTKSFIILVNGRIVLEEYFSGHTADHTWQWNSAGKTLVTAATCLAQQEGLIDINDKVSDYLGTNWTSESLDKENLITSRHLLTMTSGINDEKNLVIRSNLTYKADAGTRWSYHNVFQKLMDVVAEASNQDFDTFFNMSLKDKIGMEGFWKNGLIFKIYHSDTRSMARFGLLALNKGKWNNQQVINESLFHESINTSQNLNPAYGYMWWLNGKSSFMLPGGQEVYQGPLVPNAPADMYGAMGFEEQRIYVIPGKNMVVVRMGDGSNSGNSNFALSNFDNALWERLNTVIN